MKLKIKHINILMALLMVTGIILATVVPTIESISNARSMKVQVNSKDEKPLIDGENYSFTSQTKRHDHKVDWTFKFTKNKSDEAEQFSLVLNENQEDFTEFDDFSINGNDLAVPDMKKSIEKLEADEQEDLEELEQDDDEAREAAQHGELTWQEVTADDEDGEKAGEDAEVATEEPKYQLVYTTAEPTKQAEELEISFSTRINDEVYAANDEVKLEVQPHLVAGMTEKLPLGEEGDKKLAKNAKSYEITVDAKAVAVPESIKQAQANVETFASAEKLPEATAELKSAEEVAATTDKNGESAKSGEKTKLSNEKNEVKSNEESTMSTRPGTRSAINDQNTATIRNFDPTKYQFTTTGGANNANTALITSTNVWETLEVSQVQVTQVARSTNWRTFNAWASGTTGTVNITNATTNNPGAPGTGTNLQIYQKDDYATYTGAPTQTLRQNANSEFFGETATPTANRWGYLFEFNMDVGNNRTTATPAWASTLKLHVQYGNAGKYFTPENPEGLPMGALVTYSQFTFGNNSTGNRMTGIGNHPVVDVSNTLMGGFMMDGIRDMRVRIQYFSLKENGDFDKLLDIQPIETSNNALKSWITIGPLVQHSAGTAGDFTGAEAVSKTSDVGNYDLATEPSIGSLMQKIPDNANNTMGASYGGMYTSNTTTYANKLGMLEFEKQAISFQTLGTSTELRFKNGNGYFLKSLSSSFVRPVAPKQPTKKVTASTTSIISNELDANAPDNESTVRLNDGDTDFTYNDAQTHTIAGNASDNTRIYYPGNVVIRRTVTTTNNPWGQQPTTTRDYQISEDGGTTWRNLTRDTQYYGSKLTGTGSLNNTNVGFDDGNATKYVVNNNNTRVTYPDGSIIEKRDGKIYLRTNTADITGVQLTKTTMVGGPTNVNYLYSDRVNVITNALYSATKAANGTYSTGQTANVHFYDITQPTYHIPDDSVTKPAQIIIEDTLPIGLRPAIDNLNFNINGEATWQFTNANYATTSFSLWDTNGGRYQTTTNRSNITVTRRQVELNVYEYKIRWALTTQEINYLIFNGQNFTFRIPVVVDTSNARIDAITDENPYPSYELLNQARTYMHTDNVNDTSRAFDWNGRTNMVKTQIRFTDFAPDEKFMTLGIKKIWDDPTNSSPTQMAASGMAIVQKAKESQPGYLDFQLYQQIGETAPVDTGQIYRLEKPSAGIYQWPPLVITGLTNKTNPNLGNQKTIKYSLREIEPEHYTELTSQRRQLTRTVEDTRPEFKDNLFDEYFEFTNKPIVLVGGKKTWDENGELGVNHTSLTLYLTVDGAKQMNTTRLASPTTDWTYRFTNQPRFGYVDTNTNGKQDENEKWHEYMYGVTENTMTGYVKLDDLRAIDFENGDTTHNITNVNKFVPEKLPIDGYKLWADEDNVDGRRPTKLGLRLIRSKGDGSAPVWISSYVTDVNGGDGNGGLGTWKFDFGSTDAKFNTSALSAQELIDAKNKLFAKDYLSADGNRENYDYSIEEFTYDDSSNEIDHVPGYHRGQTKMNLKEIPNYKDPTTGSPKLAYSYEFEITNTADPKADITSRKTLLMHVISADDTNLALSGVTFAIYQYSLTTKSWIYYDEKTTDRNGDLSFTSLGAGTNDPTLTGNTAAQRVNRDNGIKYRLQPVSTPIGYAVPNYELEFELVYNMAAGTGATAIPAKRYTVLRNSSLKLFENTNAQIVGQGVQKGLPMFNTTSNNFADFGSMQRAVELDLTNNVGNSHNAVDNMTYTAPDGNVYRYYDGNLSPTTTIANSNHIDREVRLIIKIDRRKIPFPTTGGIGLALIVIGACGLLGTYAWRTLHDKYGSLRGGSDE